MTTLWSTLVRLNAQTSDWQVVQGIAPGSFISVSALDHRGRRECELLNVTDSDLSCATQRGRFRRLSFTRSEIREVRLERPEQHRMIRGAIIGGAIGAAIGGLLGGRSDDPESQSAAPAVGALFGASLGAGIGRGIHRHGPVLYQRK